MRRVDGLGQLVLPEELRRRFAIAAGDQVEIWVEGDRVEVANCHRTGSRIRQFPPLISQIPQISA